MAFRRLLCALTLLAFIPAGQSANAAITASQLARECNRTERFEVDGSTLVQGGTGRMARFCVIALGPGESLILDGVTLRGFGRTTGFVVDGQEGSSIQVANSHIQMPGFIQLSPGCCAGDGEPGHAEENATMTVTNSALIAPAVEVSASIADDGGTVLVQNSTIQALGADCGCVAILASVAGTGGSATASGNSITADGTVRIATADGTTTASGNTFSGPATVEITAGTGTCSSTGNTPAVPCS